MQHVDALFARLEGAEREIAALRLAAGRSRRARRLVEALLVAGLAVAAGSMRTTTLAAQGVAQTASAPFVVTGSGGHKLLEIRESSGHDSQFAGPRKRCS